MRISSWLRSAVLVASIFFSGLAEAQSNDADLRALHDRAVFATVKLTARAWTGTGWLLSQPKRSLIITNRHVANDGGSLLKVEYYQGTGKPTIEGTAKVLWVSSTADLAVAVPLEEPPAESRPLRLAGDNAIVRGEKVVLSGNPNGLTFQTTEGVVTGASPEIDFREASCGFGKNCVVIDAAAFNGSSGGPALNRQGSLVGMIWGIPNMKVQTGNGRELPAWVKNPTFAFLIHVRVIEAELKRWGEENRQRSPNPN